MGTDEVYVTESLDLAAWLMSHDLPLVDVRQQHRRRHQFVFGDPKHQGKSLALSFMNSRSAVVLSRRSDLISITKAQQSSQGH